MEEGAVRHVADVLLVAALRRELHTGSAALPLLMAGLKWVGATGL